MNLRSEAKLSLESKAGTTLRNEAPVIKHKAQASTYRSIPSLTSLKSSAGPPGSLDSVRDGKPSTEGRIMNRLNLLSIAFGRPTSQALKRS